MQNALIFRIKTRFPRRKTEEQFSGEVSAARNCAFFQEGNLEKSDTLNDLEAQDARPGHLSQHESDNYVYRITTVVVAAITIFPSQTGSLKSRAVGPGGPGIPLGSPIHSESSLSMENSSSSWLTRCRSCTGKVHTHYFSCCHPFFPFLFCFSRRAFIYALLERLGSTIFRAEVTSLRSRSFESSSLLGRAVRHGNLRWKTCEVRSCFVHYLRWLVLCLFLFRL